MLGSKKDYYLIVLLSALPHAVGHCVEIKSERVFSIPTYVFSGHISSFPKKSCEKQSHKNISAPLEKFLPLFVLLALESFANILLCPELRPIESWKNSSKVVLF